MDLHFGRGNWRWRKGDKELCCPQESVKPFYSLEILMKHGPPFIRNTMTLRKYILQVWQIVIAQIKGKICEWLKAKKPQKTKQQQKNNCGKAARKALKFSRKKHNAWIKNEFKNEVWESEGYVCFSEARTLHLTLVSLSIKGEGGRLG